MNMYKYTNIFCLLWLHFLILLTNQNSGFCEFFPLGYKIAVIGLPFGEMILYTLTTHW